ncbi:hypothetical protein JG687_00013316 [Phytophthora cactorum]|uniref:Uncharacterized protein n=1 Tax=Phytophthora cactorum TaxID=29920 RepID=A0A329STN6_9STRA|nr:hypothetical protein Pcac1_g25443 [Phytophthora cactorum]KAG2802328.1 hypothetical protein PC112_g19678 [Phytophthora cactorum]KAG2839198.1 hypothetical protein PC113_g19516 [Phytophthora cactorum]KAG2881806.1 hypothetical protein PC114_g21380 [Phytophthora cactorum]KAG2891956.1 hypothetical protein PC115_g19021 [Phytophthora cactorum]
MVALENDAALTVNVVVVEVVEVEVDVFVAVDVLLADGAVVLSDEMGTVPDL